jgi:hypothetical protein
MSFSTSEKQSPAPETGGTQSFQVLSGRGAIWVTIIALNGLSCRDKNHSHSPAKRWRLGCAETSRFCDFPAFGRIQWDEAA